MDLEQVIERINNGETRKEVGESLNMSNSTLSRRIKEAGYIYDNTTKKYNLASPTNEPTKERNNEPTKQGKKEPTKEPKKEQTNLVRKRASFDLDINLLKQLKIYAIQQDKNVYEIVEQAIKNYILSEKK